MENDIIQTISMILIPTFMAVISFFLKSLFSRFGELEKEIKQSLIRHENFEQRIINLERRIGEMQGHIEALQQQIWENLKNK